MVQKPYRVGSPGMSSENQANYIIGICKIFELMDIIGILKAKYESVHRMVPWLVWAIKTL